MHFVPFPGHISLCAEATIHDLVPAIPLHIIIRLQPLQWFHMCENSIVKYV